MSQDTTPKDVGDPPASFTEWCAANKQVIDRRSAADGHVRMVHTKQNEAIDCPSTPDLTLVLIVGQELALPSHQYDFGFGKIEGRPAIGSLALLPHGISTAKTGGGPYESLNLSIDFCDLQERFEIAGINAPVDFGVLHSKLWRDDPIERLVLELWKDGNDASPAGLLYSDSLYSALLARLMMLAEHPLAELPVHARLTAELVRVVEQHMRDHLEEKIPLEDLAEAVGYSRFHFSRLFKAATGETANHFLMRLRVEKAVLLIRDVGLEHSLAQVAAECGFSDQSHLTRQFRLGMGVTPAVYRKQI